MDRQAHRIFWSATLACWLSRLTHWSRPAAFVALLGFGLALWGAPQAPAQGQQTITIAVLEPDRTTGHAPIWDRMQTTLNAALPGFRFDVLRLDDRAEFDVLAQNGAVQYIVTPPDVHVAYEVSHGAGLMLTLRHGGPRNTVSRIGGVIFGSADSTTVTDSADLPQGTRVVTERPDGFDWLTVRRHLQLRHINPDATFAVSFAGLGPTQVVQAVMDGRFDIGVVPTGVLDQMLAEGEISATDVVVIDRASDAEFPYLHSTALYPEWALSEMPGADENLTRRISEVLLGMNVAAGQIGTDWQLPSNYWPVHQLLQELEIAPYEGYWHTALYQIIDRNLSVLIAIGVLFVTMFVLLVVVSVRNILLLNRRKHVIDVQSAELDAQKVALDHHAVVTMSDAAGNCIYANDNFVRLTGYSRKEIIGRQTSDLWPAEIGRAEYAKMEKTVLGGSVWSGEIPTLKKDGTIFWSQATIMPVFDSEGTFVRTTSIRTNITAIKEAEAKRQISASFDLLSKRVAIFRPDTYEFIYMNHAALAHAGWQDSGWAGKTVADYAPGFDAVRFARRIEALKDSDEQSQRFEARSFDGGTEEVSLHYLAPLDEEPRIVALIRDITEEVQQRNELEDLRAALDLADYEVFIIDPETLHYTYLNRAAQRTVGWEDVDYTTKTPADDDPRFVEEVFRERVRPLVEGRSKVVTFERGELHERATEVSIQLLNLGQMGERFVVVVRDITERKEWEREIRRFKMALDLSPDAVHMFWPDTLQFFYGNIEAHRRVGTTAEQFRQMTPMDANPHLSREVLASRLEKLMQGERKSIVYEAVHPSVEDGPMPVEVNLQYISPGNARPYFLALIRNLTASKTAEKAKSEFVATVSHELRTPLTSIKGALGLVRGGHVGEVGEKQLAMIDIAYNNCERLVLLINDILDVEKIEAGKMEFRMQTADIVALVRESIQSMQSFAAQYDVKLELDLHPAEARVSVDTNRMMQVLFNLTSNAIKFSDKGQRVIINIQNLPNRVRVMISDVGSGIPFKAQPTIFEKFTQADSSDVRRKGGTGLGLSISRMIVENMGGRIDFASAPGQGTDFWFDLPLAGHAGGPLLPAPLDGDPTRSILICEDDTQHAAVVKATLDRAGYRTMVCRTAREARLALKQMPFDAMMLDLGLRNANGSDILRELDGARDAGALPVVVSAKRISDGGGRASNPAGVFRNPPDQSELQSLLSYLAERAHDDHPTLLHVTDDGAPAADHYHPFGDAANVITAGSLDAARDVLKARSVDLVLLDVARPGGDGLDLLDEIRALHSARVPVIIFSANETIRYDESDVTSALLKTRNSNEAILEKIKSVLQSKRDKETAHGNTGTHSSRRG